MLQASKATLILLLVIVMSYGNYAVYQYVGFWNYAGICAIGGLCTSLYMFHVQREIVKAGQLMAHYNIEHREEYIQHLKRMGL